MLELATVNSSPRKRRAACRGSELAACNVVARDSAAPVCAEGVSRYLRPEPCEKFRPRRVLSDEELEIVSRHSRTTAHRYARMVWWADRAALVQDGWVAGLDAAQRFEEERGTPFGAYIWQATLNHVTAQLRKSGAPVSASHRTKVLHGLHGASLDVPATGEPSSDGALGERWEVSASNNLPAPDEALTVERHRSRVRERVQALVGKSGLDFALGLLGGEFTPAQIAEAHDTPVEQVYALRQRVRHILEKDSALYALWKESLDR